MTQKTKLLASLDAVFDACDVQDGAVLSFHHHLRNGDWVLNLILAVAARRGLKNLHVAASSIFPVHAPMVEHIRSGVVGAVCANFCSGPVGQVISNGLLPAPVTLRSHGGRARAIHAGDLAIDVAFVAAPAADPQGNISGRSGPASCGVMGYPQDDAEAATHVVAVTDCLMPYPVPMIDIAQDKVDFVVEVDQIGDPSGIASGTTRPANDDVSRMIGELAARVVAASGVLVDGFSFQTGAGGISLAAASEVGKIMATHDIRGSFMSGGITGLHVGMLKHGLFDAILDVQCFDLAAAESYRTDARHQSISASVYAGPHVGGAVVDQLSAVILGAAEIDAGFNVNVMTNGTGAIIGGSGGHADTAQGADLTILTTRLTAGGYPKLVEQVRTVSTPGRHVDVVVTEVGIAVNSHRHELADNLRQAGLPVMAIRDLIARAGQKATRSRAPMGQGRIAAISQYRDGSTLDVLRMQFPE